MRECLWECAGDWSHRKKLLIPQRHSPTLHALLSSRYIVRVFWSSPFSSVFYTLLPLSLVDLVLPPHSLFCTLTVRYAVYFSQYSDQWCMLKNKKKKKYPREQINKDSKRMWSSSYSLRSACIWYSPLSKHARKTTAVTKCTHTNTGLFWQHIR